MVGGMLASLPVEITTSDTSGRKSKEKYFQRYRTYRVRKHEGGQKRASSDL